MSDLIATAVNAMSREHYTDHPELGSAWQRTAQPAIERDLARAGVERGMRVMEIGTGTGYSGALLSEMVGHEGHVVSIDIDPDLTDRAAKLHAERGVSNLTLLTRDGHEGAAERGPFDVVIAWATPTHIPAAWVAQTRAGGRISTPIYIAPISRIVGHVVVEVNEQGVPTRPILGPAVYIDMGPEVNTTKGMPLFHVDAGTDDGAWISVGWRDMTPDTDPRTAFDLLREPNFVQKLVFSDDEREQATRWRDFRAYCVGRDTGERSNVTAYGTGEPDWITSIGFTSGHNAAVLTAEGQLMANSADSSALAKLREFIRDWYDAGKPGLESLHGVLTQRPEGWMVTAVQHRDGSARRTAK